MKYFTIICGMGALIIAGCTVGPEYDGAPSASENTWLKSVAEDKHSTDKEIDNEWWKNFNDPVLTELVTTAAEDNIDLRIAVTNIQRARSLWSAARAGVFPVVQGNASYTRQRRSENSEFGSFSGIELITDTYNVGFDASWELDLFGRLRRQIESGRAELESAAFNAADALVTVRGEIARTYLQMRAAQQLTDIAVQQAALQNKTRDLVQVQFEEGEVSEYQLAQISTLAATTEAEIPRFRAQAKTAAYNLALLTGREPNAYMYLMDDNTDIPQISDPVRVGMRSDLLQRRPDIRSAERQLAARTADIGAAVARLYPSIDLTASLGLQSLESDDLFDAASRTWRISPGLTMPIFNRAEISANIENARADRRIAALEYQQAVLGALNEAQTALTGYAESLDSANMFSKAVTQSRKSEELADLRYESGEDDLLALMDAQERLLNTRQGLVNARLEAAMNLVSLYKALGGGWQGDTIVPLSAAERAAPVRNETATE